MAARTSTGKNAAYRTSVSSHEPIHSNANNNAKNKPRINWFVMGSWTAIMLLCLAFWAGVISLFM